MNIPRGRQSILMPAMAAVLLASVLFGELFKLPIFQGSSGGLLVSDVVVVLLAIGFWAAVLIRRVAPIPFLLTRGLGAWMAVVLVGSLLALPHYSRSQDVVGLGYLVRLAAYVSLVPAGYALFARFRSLILRYAAYLCFALLALGALILHILPNFAVLAPLGWDPHVGRMTSTWLDPNFFGSFLAMMFALFLAFAERAEQDRRLPVRIGYFAFMLMLWIGIYLTYSRSALVTLAVGGIAAGFLTRWRNVAYVAVLLVIMVALPSRLQSRFVSSVDYSVSSAQQAAGQSSSISGSALGQSAASVDPTANDRVESWKAALRVFKARPAFGVGYNFYEYYRLQTGMISQHEVDAVHSASGSDSSLFTLLATTGAIGTLAFLAWWIALLRRLWPARKDPLVAGMLGSLLAWFVSSFFNNTLLYAHIMLPMLLLTGISLACANGGDRPE